MAGVLVNCSSIPQFPAKFIYEVDMENQVCGKYKITDYEDLDIAHVKDLPFKECEGVFGFSSDKVGAVLDWSRQRIDDSKHCRNGR